MRRQPAMVESVPRRRPSAGAVLVGGGLALALSLAACTSSGGDERPGRSSGHGTAAVQPPCEPKHIPLDHVDLDQKERDQLLAGAVPPDVTALKSRLAGRKPDTSELSFSIDDVTLIAGSQAVDNVIRLQIGMPPVDFPDSVPVLDPGVPAGNLRIIYEQTIPCDRNRA